MDDSANNLPTSHLLGSVPAAISEQKSTASSQGIAISEANLQVFPPTNVGHQSPEDSHGVDENTSQWKGVFSISSYQTYFDVDTDVVLYRIKYSLYPLHDNFFAKVIKNPDLYGPLWISTTLVFVFSALGNYATYLMDSRTNVLWNYDVSYIKLAACVIYGYLAVVPTAFYFLLQYLGSAANLICLWCMWGYSLFIFTLASFLLIIPVEFFRWVIILIVGSASACFVSLNLKSYTKDANMTLIMVGALVLQFALAIIFKVYFFP